MSSSKSVIKDVLLVATLSSSVCYDSGESVHLHRRQIQGPFLDHTGTHRDRPAGRSWSKIHARLDVAASVDSTV